MAQDQTQVVGGHGLIFYDAPYVSTNALPALAGYGTAWGAPYVNRGYTQGGLHVNWRRQFTEWDVDQEVVPVLRTPEMFDLRLQADLAQFDLSIIQAATQQQRVAGTPITTAAAGSGTRGSVLYDVGGGILLNYVSVGFEAQNPGDGEAVQVLGKKGIPVGDVSLTFGPRPPGAVTNYEVALVPDTTTTPSTVAQFRDVIPQLP